MRYPRITETLIKVFSVDLRSLALFRIALGITVLTDLTLRSLSIRAFYTDDGVLPRAALGSAARLFHSWGGTVEYQAVLLIIAGVFAAMLVLGRHTRMATIVSWIFLLSLRARNDIIINGGDRVLFVMLFWSMFLPLGARWSLDALRRRKANLPDPYNGVSVYTSVAVAGLFLQIVLIYFMSGTSKLFNHVWLSGDGVANAFGIQMLTTTRSEWLLQYPTLLEAASYATLTLETLGALLLISPWRTHLCRSIALPLFWAFHVAIALCMKIGLFPAITIVATFCLIPGSWWPRGIAAGARNVRHAPPLRAPVQWLAMLALAYTGWSALNAASGEALPPSSLTELERRCAFRQKWTMFYNPQPSCVWFVYAAELNNGETLDLLSGETQDLFAVPDLVSTRFQSMPWRRHLLTMNLLGKEALWDELGHYLMYDWNRRHATDRHVRSLTIYKIYESDGDFRQDVVWPQTVGDIARHAE